MFGEELKDLKHGMICAHASNIGRTFEVIEWWKNLVDGCVVYYRSAVSMLGVNLTNPGHSMFAVRTRTNI